MRYELTVCEWAAIKASLPHKPRGVPRVNDRRGSTASEDDGRRRPGFPRSRE
jgi:hypothetical protein